MEQGPEKRLLMGTWPLVGFCMSTSCIKKLCRGKWKPVVLFASPNSCQFGNFTRRRGMVISACDVELLKKEMAESDTPMSYSGSGALEKSIRKASLEVILHRLLNFLRPETFVGAVKAINQKILSVMDETETCRVDLGMFFAILAPICSGSPKKRKPVAFDALLWRPVNEDSTQIKKSKALRYIKLLKAIRLMRVGFSTSLQTRASFT
ncbi:hypothetical protein ACSBR1_002714 [Camellia fascicularis]